MHTGNVGSPFRQRLAAVAKKNPDDARQRALHRRPRQDQADVPRAGARAAGRLPAAQVLHDLQEQCGTSTCSTRRRSATRTSSSTCCSAARSSSTCSDGMRTRSFTSTACCRACTTSPVEPPSDVPAMVRWLRKNDDYARAVAAAGRARMSTLDVDGATTSGGGCFTQYASRQSFRPAAAGRGPIDCERRPVAALRARPRSARPAGAARTPARSRAARRTTSTRSRSPRRARRRATAEHRVPAGHSFELHGKFVGAPEERRMWTEGLSFGRN